MPWRHPARALFLAMVVNLGLAGSVAYLTVTTLDANCDRRVEAREDSRAMWIWLTDQFPGKQVAIDARIELDERLPSLRCSWWRPISITEEP